MSLALSTSAGTCSPLATTVELGKHSLTALVHPISLVQTTGADVARMLPLRRDADLREAFGELA